MPKKKPDQLKGASYFKDGFEFSILRLKHSFRTSFHGHDFHELVFTSLGQGFHKTLKSKRAIRRGNVFFIEKGLPHNYQIPKEIEIINILFSEKLAADIGRNYLAGSVPDNANIVKFLSQKLRYPVMLAPAETVKIEMAAEAIRKEYRNKGAGYETLIKTRLAEIFILLIRHVQEIKSVKMTELENDERITRALKLISERYAGKLTLKEIAGTTGLVPAYFSTLFRKLTGYSVFEYLNEYRIYKAADLLKNTKKPVLELAYETGFNSISLFNRTFKRLTGKTPLQYRKTARAS